MAVLQHYYTSYVNRESGSAGFQVKAMSPGIAPDTQALITRLLSYRIPPRLDEYALDTHPIALRYFYRNPREAILLCSQSSGTDENGRPGNFFAHSLVVEPEYFTSMPPILYWRSPFWRVREPRAAMEIAPLQTLEEVETTFDVEAVWRFLAQNQRLEQFRKLMSALVHSARTQRRLVIIDSADNVAQWIAALTLMLPPDYRPLLSFSTYHHDPYQAQFLVTGTSSDSLFRATPDEYLSYFILDAERGKMSDVDPSPYADQAWKAACSYQYYETKLLSLMTNYAVRFPNPEMIDTGLDLLALYAGLLEPQHSPFDLAADEIRAASLALDSLERTTRFSPEELNEIQRLGTILQEASKEDTEAYEAYRRCILLSQRHGLSTDQSALHEFTFITWGLTSQEQQKAALERWENMRLTYGDALFLATLNSSQYLHTLNQITENASLEQLQTLWKYLGPFIRPEPAAQQFLLSSLNKGGHLWADRVAREKVKEFFEQISLSIRGQEAQWLSLLVDQAPQIYGDGFIRFYILLVGSLELDQRLRYRAIVRPVYPNTEFLEMRYDLTKPDIRQALSTLETWIDHAQRLQLDALPSLLDAGLKRLQELYPQQLPDMVPQILHSPVLAPLSVEWENRLLVLAFAKISFYRASRNLLELYEEYRGRVDLPPEIDTIMDGSQAMLSGELSDELAERLYIYFSHLPPENFQREARSFIRTFLSHCRSEYAHTLLIKALFIDWHDLGADFWDPYFEKFTSLLVTAETAPQAFTLLAYWFHMVPGQFANPYIPHYFFLFLPRCFTEARKEKGFRDVIRYAQLEQKRWRWYPLLQEHLATRKTVVSQVGQGLAQLQRRLVNSEEVRAQEGKELGERTALEGRIRLLFVDRRSRRLHREQLASTYDRTRHELFWTIYRHYFKDLLVAGESEDILDALAFWFDDAFSLLEDLPSLPQEFFLGLSELLEEAQKERGFRTRAQQIYNQWMQARKKYHWFALVESFFVEPEKRFSLFRRG